VEWWTTLANSLSSLGSAYALLNKHESSLAAYNRAVTVCEEFIQTDPTNIRIRRSLTQIYANYGDTLLERGQKDKAFLAFQKGADLAEHLIQLNPSNAMWQFDLASAYSRKCVALPTSHFIFITTAW
jgi:tetratricopeptide (TPR) repeat protein